MKFVAKKEELSPFKLQWERKIICGSSFSSSGHSVDKTFLKLVWHVIDERLLNDYESLEILKGLNLMNTDGRLMPSSLNNH